MEARGGDFPKVTNGELGHVHTRSPAHLLHRELPTRITHEPWTANAVDLPWLDLCCHHDWENSRSSQGGEELRHQADVGGAGVQVSAPDRSSQQGPWRARWRSRVGLACGLQGMKLGRRAQVQRPGPKRHEKPGDRPAWSCVRRIRRIGEMQV